MVPTYQYLRRVQYSTVPTMQDDDRLFVRATYVRYASDKKLPKSKQVAGIYYETNFTMYLKLTSVKNFIGQSVSLIIPLKFHFCLPRFEESRHIWEMGAYYI